MKRPILHEVSLSLIRLVVQSFAGPIAMVDLSAPLFDFGSGTLDVGLRTSALFDVGSGQRVHVNAAPFIRVDISLR